MLKHMKKFAAGLIAIMAVLALSMLVVGCSGSSGSENADAAASGESSTSASVSDDSVENWDDESSSIGWSDDGETLEIEAENVAGDQSVTYALVLDAATDISVSSELSSGTVHIMFYDGNGIADIEETDFLDYDASQLDGLFEYEISGNDSDTISLDAGQYVLVISGDDSAPATGTVTLTK